MPLPSASNLMIPNPFHLQARSLSTGAPRQTQACSASGYKTCSTSRASCRSWWRAFPSFPTPRTPPSQFERQRLPAGGQNNSNPNTPNTPPVTTATRRAYSAADDCCSTVILMCITCPAIPSLLRNHDYCCALREAAVKVCLGAILSITATACFRIGNSLNS